MKTKPNKPKAITKKVRFCDTPTIIHIADGYPRNTYDANGREIPMRMHKSETYRRIIVGKFYHDFLRMIALNDPWAPGMCEFSNEVYSYISIITETNCIDIYLSNQNKLFEYFFIYKDDSYLVQSVYEILKKQTLFLFHEQHLLNQKISQFQKVLYEHSYCYKKICVSNKKLTHEEIYSILVEIYSQYLKHPDLVY